MHNLGQDERSDSVRDDRSEREAPPPGVIDTIGDGYAALVLRPLAILPIVLLDLYLLFGPSVMLAPLIEEISGRDVAAAELEQLEGFNAFDVGALGVPLLRTPGIVPSFTGDRVGDLRVGSTWTNASGGIVVVLLIASLAIGLLWAAIYRSLLAQAALSSRGDSIRLGPSIMMRRAGRIAAWVLALVGLAILIAMPVLVAAIVGVVVGFGTAALLWLLLLFPATWAWVHFFFSIHAIVIDDAGPLEALRSSYKVVQHHFWQSVRFMAASLLITTGLSFALRELAVSLPGALLAILLNAIVASGMIVAAMLFYRDRAIHLGLHAQVPGR